MLNRVWGALRRNPTIFGLAIATALAGVNLFVLTRTLQITRAGRELAAQTAPLKANLAELQRAKEEGFASLRKDIALAEQELNSLRSSFPQAGAPFDLYRRGMTLAQSSRVEIVSVERGSTTVDDTTMGELTKTTYTIETRGSMQHCLTFMSQLEDEGLSTVALDNISIDPTAEECNFDVHVGSVSPADAQSPAVDETSGGGLP
jgi:hypothetical protein